MSITKTPTPGAPDPHWGQGGQYVIDPANGLRARLGPPAAASGAYVSSPAKPDAASNAPEAEATTPAAAVDSVVIPTNLVIDAALQRVDTSQPKKGTK